AVAGGTKCGVVASLVSTSASSGFSEPLCTVGLPETDGGALASAEDVLRDLLDRRVRGLEGRGLQHAGRDLVSPIDLADDADAVLREVPVESANFDQQFINLIERREQRIALETEGAGIAQPGDLSFEPGDLALVPRLERDNLGVNFRRQFFPVRSRNGRLDLAVPDLADIGFVPDLLDRFGPVRDRHQLVRSRPAQPAPGL